MQKPTMQMPVIGGYIIVAHLICNGWSDNLATHAFDDLNTAKKHVRARAAEISNRYFDEYNSESNPTLHAVSPKLFEKVQELLSRQHDYDNFAYRLGEAITRQKYPYSYRVGEAEVFCTRSENREPAAASARPAARRPSAAPEVA